MLETMKCSPEEKASTTTQRERRFRQPDHRATWDTVNPRKVRIAASENKGLRVQGRIELQMANRKRVRVLPRRRESRISMWGPRGESNNDQNVKLDSLI